jgi:hypothetical protein
MIRKIGVVFIFFLIPFIASAQTEIPRAQALFIYNFSRLIEWPPNYKTGPFVIGVLGSAPITEQLKTFTSGKQVGTQPITVKTYGSPEEISTCHILFVPFSETKYMARIVSQVATKSTLIITEKNAAIEEGSAINFVVIGDKLKFELSPDHASKYNIKLSSKLNEMAYKIY